MTDLATIANGSVDDGERITLTLTADRRAIISQLADGTTEMVYDTHEPEPDLTDQHAYEIIEQMYGIPSWDLHII